MKLLVIADEDSFINNLSGEGADVLISCGDLADPTILQAARMAQCSRIFAVKGNHDSSNFFPSPIVDMHLRTETCGGLVFGGFRGCWKYKSRGNFIYDQDEVKRSMAVFPPVDVFVAHNSPRHVHDREDEVHLGFEAFGEYIERTQPRLFFHGHMHINQETVIGRTRVIGVFEAKRFEI